MKQVFEKHGAPYWQKKKKKVLFWKQYVKKLCDGGKVI